VNCAQSVRGVLVGTLRHRWMGMPSLALTLVLASALLAACGGSGSSKGAGVNCTIGTEGCNCFPDQTCTQPGPAPTLACRSQICTTLSCPAGSPGCPCALGQCSDGACLGGLCVAQDSVAPPPAPVCYSPCEQGLSLADGTYVACGQDGLMARCLDGKECVGGSCVAHGATPPDCQIESDCPDFQTCIQKRCYSNCQTNQDCSGDRVCFRHVCRKPCSSAQDVCPAETACVIRDGDTGYCMPIREASTAPETETLGTFSLSVDHLDFTNTTQSGKLVLRNDAPVGMDFTVRKVEHTEYRDAGPVRNTTAPLSWVSMGADSVQRVAQFTVFVEGHGGTREITVGSAGNPDLSRWEGRLEVSNAKLGQRAVNLSYVTRQDGRWTGKMYYFANFGEIGLSQWVAAREDVSALSRVGNAFVQRWGALRQGRISYDEFQAVVTSTRTGSWAWPSMKKLCSGTTACYPYSSAEGYGLYSDDLSAYPIPGAVSELPIAFNVATSTSDPRVLAGKIVSSESLQYTGDPAFTLTFDGDPTACKAGVGTACLAMLTGLDARFANGGRYLTTSSDTTCAREAAGTYGLDKTPWLVPGFTADTEYDSASGYRYRYECRDKTLPFGASAEAWNRSLAQSNPIPDGRPRFRRLELVDGALVNQSSLFIIFRERFEESFLGAGDSAGFAAYGFMVLNRSPADLDSAAYTGNAVADARPAPTDVLGPGCKDELVKKLLGSSDVSTSKAVTDLALGLLDGVAATASAVSITSGSTEQVHYLCHQTGLFDGGSNDQTGIGIRIPCPAGSGVTYFTNTRTRDQIALESCQKTGSCQDTLDQWKINGAYGLRLNPVWRCSTSGKVYCDTDRLDLRADKIFYATGSTGIAFPPLLTAIDGAFRYKTQFTSRTGQSVGFAPEICVPDSNAIPYCYDPPAIEQIRDRVDCALSLYTTRYSDLSSTAQNRLKAFFTQSFGYQQDNSLGTPLTSDGFEKLNAELLIMQGDEAYTRAFASRFDLAGSRMVSFEGSLFEPDGMNLAGGAGNEMYNLYLAAQYYQLALDRFYGLSPAVWQSIKGDTGRNFVGKETVVAYFDRLIRASTQKARAWSEVAKRYQSFNRPDLARHVVERAYAAAYLESVVLSRMMLKVVAVAAPADRDFIASRADLAALGYRAALLDMRDVWASIVDQPTNFGFAPDYIPFPALDPADVNAFTKLLANAKASLAQAESKETQALASTRAYDTDAAQFQAELIRIRQNFESQLAGLCGTFTGGDGLVHPAVRTYAHLDPRAAVMGDPCGLMGNGKLSDAMAAVEQVGLNMSETSLRYSDVLAAIQIERERVSTQCQKTVALADYKWSEGGKIKDLQTQIQISQEAKAVLDRARQDAGIFFTLQKCSTGVSTDCPTAMVATVGYQIFTAASDVAMVGLDVAIDVKQSQIEDIQRATARWETLHQCEVAQVDSDAVVKNKLLELAHLDLDALKNEYSLKLALAQVDSLRNEATRVLAQQEELEQQTINVEAARNDPNVRIYKNDAVILSDDTFRAAVRDAYVATKAFEYYTSQSYAHLVDLFLVRMVAHGDYNLETYLADLEYAYREFQQQYGNPDHRVEIVSLRDDVLGIPRTDTSGRALTQAERIALFRQRLTDPGFIDERGYRTIPFSTDLTRLSPLTRNHKITALEAEVIGADVGDTIGRIYVRQRGTGVVASVDNEKLYYRLPERTAVLNAFFNGVRTFGQDVYRSDRLRDRAFANTHWELVLNQLDEIANQDINLQSVTDIRVYVYYTDFTQL
jgi:hypothetical protein